MCSWTPSATLRPIVADISDEETRGFVLGYWLALEGCASAFGAPVVAYLSQDIFGYTPSALPVSIMDETTRHINANALSNALVYTMIFPWLICIIFFTLMHWTYPGDLRKMKEEEDEARLEDEEAISLLMSQHEVEVMSGGRGAYADV